MRWTPGGRSSNLEDRRGGGGFGGGGLKLGIGGTLVLLVLSFVFKQDFFSMIDSGAAGAPTEQSQPVNDPKEEPMVQFVSFVLDDAQATWRKVMERNGRDYRDARLVLFREGVRSECGSAQSAMGPFYCPADQKVYIDLGFYDDLKRRFGADGDFAQAYVLAHEIGHHVQHQLGIDEQVREQQRNNPGARNQLSVRMELQADCFAGIWAHSTEQRKILEKGDVDEALGAAAAIGDDRLQKQSTGRISPESFTHGTSQQRSEWFRRGLESGRVDACNTFQ
ncbi:MAG TPA: neutral zinc metallopeptidase [Terriglobales bacterium]|nr:neutral zinc metallopeptidase [Terriglobales bacterium]